MNAKLLMVTAAPVTAMLLAAPAAAQQDRDRQQPQRQIDRMDREQREAQIKYVLAGTVRGKDVVNRQGEDLGDITDLIVDVERGTTPYAVVSFGGLLGIARDSVAVPMRTFAWDGEEERFVLEINREQLEAAPEFDEEDWDQLHDENWRDRVRQAFGWVPGIEQDGRARDRRDGYRRDRQQTDRDRQQRDRMQQRDERREAARPDRDGEDMKPYMLVSDLKGATIVGSGGEEIGRIDDVIIDRSTGHVGFVKLQSGGVLGIGADNHPVPWEALTRVEAKEFTLTTPAGRIDDAPKLDSDDLERLNDRRFRDRIYQHFQVQPREIDRREERRRDGRANVPVRPGG